MKPVNHHPAESGIGRDLEASTSRLRRARLKDVAAAAGTSVATASRVLSGTGFVTEETRAGILGAAKQLNYHPNLHARSLRKDSVHSIGLLVPNLMDAYYAALADAIDQSLADRKYRLLIACTRDDPASERDLLYEMSGQAVDGLIWVPAAPSPALMDTLHGQHTCIVSIIRRVPGDGVDTVVFQDQADSQAATRHLVNLGHRRIGYIGGEIRYGSHHDRWQGYLTAMEQAGLAVDEQLVKLGADRSTWGFVATDDLLRLPVPPSAIFVASNAIMPGVIRTLRLRGVQVPENLSLICFDDIEWFSLAVPPITAVSVSHARLAATALELLFVRMENPGAADRQPALIRIGCDLVLRGSTAPYRS